jgi:hypothetical protein
MKQIKTLVRLVIIGIICLTALPAQAQQNNSLYFMDQLPQCTQLNPAMQPYFGFHLGVPGISSIEINGGNSAVGFNNILQYNATLDSMVWFLYDEESQDKFLSKFKKTNFVYANASIDLFSIGLRVNSNYFSFYVGDRIEARFNIPYDLVRLAVKGNQDSIGLNTPTQTFDFSTFGIDATWYREYALGFSREINNKMTFGLRGKLLFGMGNVTTKSSTVYLEETGYQLWRPHTSMEVNSSIPRLKVVTDNKDKVDSIDFENINNSDEARDMFLSNRNSGFALDLGIVYKPVPFLSIAASVLDLGYIRWKDNTHNFTQDASYDLRGVKMDLSDSADMIQTLLDTLENTFTYHTNTDPYTTTLSPKLYAGAQLRIANDLGLSFLTRMQLIERSLRSQYTLSLNFYPANSFLLTVSYTIADKMYDNLGFALSSKLGPLQWYIMSERIPLYYNRDKTGTYIPAYAKNINLRLGVNIVIGKQRHKRIYKDRPLVEI